MKVLVTGANGQVGSALAALAVPGLDVRALSRAELDITDPDAVARVFDKVQPDAVVNPAAYTAVDKAESEPELADRVNHLAPGLLAKACARASIPLVHLSTDFVFDGEKGAPYVEDDPVSPLQVYGRTKARGEDAVRESLSSHFILRVAWVYGEGTGFPARMRELFRTRESLSVVTDQRGCPTPASAIAEAVGTILLQGHDVPWGTYHFAGQPAVSRFEWVQALLEAARRDGNVVTRELVPVTSEAFPTPAKRPRDTALDCGRLRAALHAVNNGR